MLKQPHAVGLDIPGKLGPRNSILHGSFSLHWCRMNDAAGGNRGVKEDYRGIGKAEGHWVRWAVACSASCN